MSESEETISTITGIQSKGAKSPKSFEFVVYPKDEDVVTGSELDTIGNRKYRDIVSSKVEVYKHQPYSQRSIALDVIDELNSSSRSGRFLKKDNNHDAQYRVMKEDEIIKEVISDLMGQRENIPTATIFVKKDNTLHVGGDMNASDTMPGNGDANIENVEETPERVEEDAVREDVENLEEEQQVEEGTALQIELDGTTKLRNNNSESEVVVTPCIADPVPPPKASATPSIKARIGILEKMLFGEQDEDKLLIERLVWLEKNILENRGGASTFIERLLSIEFELGISV